MKIINCTPHPVDVYSADGQTLMHSFPTSGHVARVKTPPQRDLGFLPPLEGVPAMIPLVTPQDLSIGDVSGLPPPENGLALIVGVVGCQAIARAWDHGDVYVTDTGPESVVRATEADVASGRAKKIGDILGVRRLTVAPK